MTPHKNIAMTAHCILKMFPAYPWTKEDERVAEIERERVRELTRKLRTEEEQV